MHIKHYKKWNTVHIKHYVIRNLLYILKALKSTETLHIHSLFKRALLYMQFRVIQCTSVCKVPPWPSLKQRIGNNSTPCRPQPRGRHGTSIAQECVDAQ